MEQTPRMRPRFEIPLAADGEQVLAHLRSVLAAGESPFMGQVSAHHAVLKLPLERRSLLSPHLELELELAGPGSATLRGRFAPHPNVWTGFMAVYGVLAMIGVCGLMYGLAQLVLGESPWALVLAPAAAAVIAFVYGAAVIGQGLCVGEMYELRAFVDEIVRQSRGRNGAGG